MGSYFWSLVVHMGAAFFLIDWGRVGWGRGRSSLGIDWGRVGWVRVRGTGGPMSKSAREAMQFLRDYRSYSYDM